MILGAHWFCLRMATLRTVSRETALFRTRCCLRRLLSCRQVATQPPGQLRICVGNDRPDSGHALGDLIVRRPACRPARLARQAAGQFLDGLAHPHELPFAVEHILEFYWVRAPGHSGKSASARPPASRRAGPCNTNRSGVRIATTPTASRVQNATAACRGLTSNVERQISMWITTVHCGRVKGSEVFRAHNRWTTFSQAGRPF
jgi:hypothetical protein